MTIVQAIQSLNVQDFPAKLCTAILDFPHKVRFQCVVLRCATLRQDIISILSYFICTVRNRFAYSLIQPHIVKHEIHQSTSYYRSYISTIVKRHHVSQRRYQTAYSEHAVSSLYSPSHRLLRSGRDDVTGGHVPAVSGVRRRPAAPLDAALGQTRRLGLCRRLPGAVRQQDLPRQ